MTIHDTNPFADPPDDVRRLRGRLGGAVSVWTAGAGGERAGLTVSSLMVANGAPAAVLGLVDGESALFSQMSATGRAVVGLLQWEDRGLAEAFGGQAPAAGGLFTMGSWTQTSHGPALLGRSRALVRLESSSTVGWSELVVATIEEIELVEDGEPLEHRRGRYRRHQTTDR